MIQWSVEKYLNNIEMQVRRKGAGGRGEGNTGL